MPITLDSTVTAADGVVFVAVRLRNTEPVDRRVRLANRLDAAVLPPRRHGTPEPGWSTDGYEGVVAAHSTRSLGYACRVAPGESLEADGDPVDLVGVDDPASVDDDPMDAVIADFPAHRPPPDAVSDSAPPNALADWPDRHTTGRTESDRSGEPTAIPPTVARYLDDVDARISRAERFASGSIADATTALEAGTDPDCVAALVALDATALARLAARADALASRADAVDVPIGALERLA